MGKRQVVDKTLIRPLWSEVGGIAFALTPGRKVDWQRCSEVELARQEPRCHGGQTDVAS